MRAGAINNAAGQLKAGDVMLIELACAGPTGITSRCSSGTNIFSAIKAAVAKGIVVVEAAGTATRTSTPRYTRNSGLQKDKWRDPVGAGVPPTNYFDFDGWGTQFPRYTTLGVPRSRIFLLQLW